MVFVRMSLNREQEKSAKLRNTLGSFEATLRSFVLRKLGTTSYLKTDVFYILSVKPNFLIYLSEA